MITITNTQLDISPTALLDTITISLEMDLEAETDTNESKFIYRHAKNVYRVNKLDDLPPITRYDQQDLSTLPIKIRQVLKAELHIETNYRGSTTPKESYMRLNSIPFYGSIEIIHQLCYKNQAPQLIKYLSMCMKQSDISFTPYEPTEQTKKAMQPETKQGNVNCIIVNGIRFV